MIKNPGPFIAAGARLPSGLLMVGPPGTGKTLMARVMASEAGVPVGFREREAESRRGQREGAGEGKQR